jgi:exopolyphosphatase/guanosine-5'-triphosphate,3'-diphosphate pyrophosphatase
VRRISALLRVADGLDRGHMAVVETLRCVVTDDLIRITALPRYAGADLALECWGATRKADLLAKLAGRKVEICGVTRVELGASA